MDAAIVGTGGPKEAPQAFVLSPLGPIPPYDHVQRAAVLDRAATLDSDITTATRAILGRHPEVAKALELFNANPLSELPGATGVDLKTGLALANTDDRTNITRHCVKVALGDTSVLRPFVRSGQLTEEDFIRAEEAGLGHDCLKSLEIDRRRAAEAKGVDIAAAYSKEGYETEERILRERGVAPELLSAFISFGQNTGHRSIAKFLVVKDGVLAGVKTDDVVALAAHVVDALTYSSKPAFGEPEINVFQPAAERMLLSKFHHAGDEFAPNTQGYPFLWTEGLGVQGDKIVEVKNIHNAPEGVHVLGSYAYLQQYTARAGANFFNREIGLPESDTPDATLSDYLNRTAGFELAQQ
jgi:hypothetical protein